MKSGAYVADRVRVAGFQINDSGRGFKLAVGDVQGAGGIGEDQAVVVGGVAVELCGEVGMDFGRWFRVDRVGFGPDFMAFAVQAGFATEGVIGAGAVFKFTFGYRAAFIGADTGAQGDRVAGEVGYRPIGDGGIVRRAGEDVDPWGFATRIDIQIAFGVNGNRVRTISESRSLAAFVGVGELAEVAAVRVEFIDAAEPDADENVAGGGVDGNCIRFIFETARCAGAGDFTDEFAAGAELVDDTPAAIDDVDVRL